jgi:hypothetical protein
MNESGMTEPGAPETDQTSVVQPAPQRARVRDLSTWINRDRQLHHEGPLTPQDRYPGRIAAP